MNNFFTSNFWFSLRPGGLLGSSMIVLVFFIVLLIIAGFIFNNLKAKKGLYRKTLDGLFNFSFTNAIIGLFLLFFSYETILFLSSRFWYLLWVIEIITWLWLILKHAKNLPKIREQRETENKYKKYLPK